jgi:hypothetical protein
VRIALPAAALTTAPTARGEPAGRCALAELGLLTRRAAFEGGSSARQSFLAAEPTIAHAAVLARMAAGAAVDPALADTLDAQSARPASRVVAQAADRGSDLPYIAAP